MLVYVLTLLPLLLILRKLLSKRPLPRIQLPPPIVQTRNGKVSGSWSYSSKERRMFASFQGIPYAKPPVGKLRLFRPEPAEDWEGVKECTRCPEFIQRNIFRKESPRSGTENALVLNIYTPNIKAKFPVLVFIHGGGFVSGSASKLIYGGENFMEKDVLLVTINYRLSVLGGLFLDGDKVPGNQGMRDQVLALRWIQDNIERFGGDKDRVTLFGESAGAMSVMNHVLSPMSKGLFSAAIAQSGVPNSPFCCLNKHPAYYGYKLVEKLGIDPTLPVEKIIDKLQELDPIALQDEAYMFEEFVRAPLPFKPIVDGGLVEDPFLPEEPLQLIKKGQFNKVPLIIGSNKDEGLLIKAFYLRDAENFEIGWRNFSSIGPLAFFAKERDEVSAPESALCLDYRKKHFGENKFSPRGPASEALVEMYGDLLFTAPADICSSLIAKTMEAPVYQYLYNYQGSLSLYDIVAYPPWRFGLRILDLVLGLDLLKTREGVCHGDELFLMFKAHAIPVSNIRSSREQQVQDNLIDMWTDFATNHNPTPRTGLWKPFDPSSPSYLKIDSCCEMEYPEKHRARMEEWRQIWDSIPVTSRIMTSPTWEQFPHDRYPVGGVEDEE